MAEKQSDTSTTVITLPKVTHGIENNGVYKFTLENKKVVRFNRYTEETGDSLITSSEFRQSDSFIGREIEIRAHTISPGATTTITIEGMSSKLKKVIVIKVKEPHDFINRTTLSPFDENAVVTDTKYY